MRGRRRRHDDRIDGIVGEHVVQVPDQPGFRVTPADSLQPLLVDVAHDLERGAGGLRGVPDEIRSPVARAHDREPDLLRHHRFPCRLNP